MALLLAGVIVMQPQATAEGASTAGLAAAGCLAFGSGSVTVYDSNQVVRSTDTGCGFQGGDIIAAQNEFESVQVVVHAPAGSALTNVSVSASQCFEWCRASQTAADTAISISREDYTQVFRRSDLESTPDPAASLANPNGGSVGWPDRLIPTKDYFYGQARNAFPRTAAPGTNVTAWVDVLVPAGQAAGTYNATLSVTAAGLALSVPLKVTVLGFSIPSTPSFQTIVGMDENRLCPGLDPTPGAPGCTSAEMWTLNSLMSRLALENRTALYFPFPTYLSNAGEVANFENYVKQYYVGTSSSRLAGARMRKIMIYGWCATDPSCINGLASIAKNENWGAYTPVFSVYCEELFKDVGNWQACHTYFNDAKAAFVNLGLAAPQLTAVASIDALNFAKNSGAVAWPTVFSDVTTLLPVVQYLNNGDTDTKKAFPGNEPNYAAFLNQGGTHQLWTYTSCYSVGCSADDGSDSYDESTDPVFRGWPSEVIDQPATEGRAVPWLAFRWGAVGGEQYYDSVKRLPQSWNTCSTPTAFQDHSTCMFSEGGNGDGTLVYAGTVAQIGGSNPIPLESLRLKRMRDGREDYEWLKWLSDHGQGQYAQDEAAKLFPQAYCTDSPAPTVPAGESQLCTQTATVALVRAELAAKIQDVLGGGGGADLSVTVTAPASAPVGDDFPASFTVKNAGAASATGVSASLTLPAKLVLESVSTPAGSCSPATQGDGSTLVSCSIGTIATGDSVTVSVVVASTDGVTKLLSATATGAQPDPNTANNSASASVGISGNYVCTIVGTPGPDTLNGTSGNDVICGLGGADTIHGNGGNDVIFGGAGADLLYGDDGNDTLVGGLGPYDDTIDGGTGANTVSVFDAAAGAAVNLQAGGSYDWDQGAGDANIGVDTLTNIQNIYGSAYGDGLVGDGNANAISGSGGDDSVESLGGNDTVDAGSGNDSVDGGDDNDTVIGGPGNDSLNGGNGTDTVSYAGTSAGVQVSLASTAAQDTGGGGTDTLGGFESLTGSSYADTLIGSVYANVINGGSGNDSVSGGAGNDTLIGGSGVDALSYAGTPANVTINLSSTAAQNTGGAGYDSVSGFENLLGSSYNDVLTGSSLANAISGGYGNDTLNGGYGNDALNGGAGTDACNGGYGTDTARYCETITSVP